VTLATGAYLHTRLFFAPIMATRQRAALRNPQTTRKMSRCAIGSARNKKAMTMNPSWPDKFGFSDEITTSNLDQWLGKN
jgi:hypothetical protein